MPSFQCLSCFKPVPDQAAVCPHCSANTAEMLATLEKREEERLLMEAFAGSRMAENAARTRRTAAAAAAAAPKVEAAVPAAPAPRTKNVPGVRELHQVTSHVKVAEEVNRFQESIAPGSLFRGFSVVAGILYFSAYGGKPVRDVAAPLLIMTTAIIAGVLVIDYLRFRPSRD